MLKRILRKLLDQFLSRADNLPTGESGEAIRRAIAKIADGCLDLLQAVAQTTPSDADDLLVEEVRAVLHEAGVGADDADRVLRTMKPERIQGQETADDE